MTNEEAKDYIREWCPYDRQEEIIKALEREPCESREAVHNLIIPWLNGYLLDETREALETIDYKIGDLPSVTPQQKTGHWIRMKAYEKWGCSECHTVFRFTFKEHDYCPNCGAKMVEPQESEE